MFKEYNQQQNFLLPPSYEDFLGVQHESKLLNTIIEGLDLKFLYTSYKNVKRGTTAYDPKMLLKVFFYGYMNETFSSRKIAKKLKSDLGFMFLAGNNQPDFRTINNFRRNKGKLLEKVFVEIIYLASELGLVRFGTFSIDGTNIYANASKHKNINLEKLEETISGLFEEADKTDNLEDEQYGENENNIAEDIESALKKAKEKYKKYKDLQDKANKENTEAKENKRSIRKNINTTDPDSRFQKMKRGNTAQGYNCQIVTENQIIIGNSGIMEKMGRGND